MRRMVEVSEMMRSSVGKTCSKIWKEETKDPRQQFIDYNYGIERCCLPWGVIHSICSPTTKIQWQTDEFQLHSAENTTVACDGKLCELKYNVMKSRTKIDVKLVSQSASHCYNREEQMLYSSLASCSSNPRHEQVWKRYWWCRILCVWCSARISTFVHHISWN